MPALAKGGAPRTKGHEKDKNTVFVRGVPFDVDESGLEGVFSDIGPIKGCFLVKPRGSDHHKGFGFVHYALAEDAQRAAEELNGKQMGGRKLQVELADKRAPMEERKKRHVGSASADAKAAPAEEDADGQADEGDGGVGATVSAAAHKLLAAAAPRSAKTAATAAAAPRAAPRAAPLPSAGDTSDKHKLLRAVAIGNLTPAVAAAALAAAREAGTVQEVMDPAPVDLVSKAKLAADGCAGGVAVVVYASVREASEAVAKLHGKSVQPAVPGATKGKKDKSKKKKKSKGAEHEHGEDDGGDGGADAKDAAATAAAAAAEPVVLWARQVAGEGARVKKWRVIVRNLPWKTNEAMLRAALEPAAGFVWELAIPRGPDGRIKGFAFAGFTCAAHAARAIQKVNGTQVAGRMVAVDWAVDKSTFEKHRDGEPGGAEGVGASNDVDRLIRKHEADKGGADSDGDGDEGSGGGGEEGGDGDEDTDGEEGEEGAAGGADAERDMMRSVLGDVMQEDGEEGGGDVAAAADGGGGERPAAEHSKPKADKRADKRAEGAEGGSGPVRSGPDYLRKTVFLRNLPLDVLQPALRARMEVFGEVYMCRIVVDKATGKPRGTAFVEFEHPADAEKAAAACARGRTGAGPGVTLEGRQLDIDMAVSQDDARNISSAGAGASGRRGSKEGEGTGKDRRNLYLAKEGRIEEGSAQWEALSESDKQKRKRSAEEMAQKLRSPNFMLSPTRLSMRNLPYSVDEKQLRELVLAAVKERASREAPRVVSVKVLREADGKGSGPDGKPRSKGIGFVELASPDHAIAALRQLNNNPKTFGPTRRPIVEFAVENTKVLKKLEEIKAKKDAAKADGREARKARRDVRAAGQDAQQAGQDGGKAAGREAVRNDGQGARKISQDGRKAAQPRNQPQSAAPVGGSGSGEAKAPGKKRERGGTAADARPSGVGATDARPSSSVDDAGTGPVFKKQKRKPAAAGADSGAGPAPGEGHAAASAAGGGGGAAANGRSKSQTKREKLKELRKKQGERRKERKRSGTADGAAAVGADGAAAAATKKEARPQPKPGVRPGDGKPAKAAAATQPAGGKRKAAAAAGRDTPQPQRHRAEDAAMDRLGEQSLAAVAAGNAGGAKRRRGGAGAGDKLDRLSEQYKAKLFGGPGSSSGGKAAQSPGVKQAAGGGLRRWFE